MGRPKIEINKDICDQAYDLAQQGLNRRQIAIRLGMSHTTLYEKMAEYADFSDAIERGAIDGIDKVTNSLFNKAIEGNVQAIQTFLYNRDPENWKRDPQESAIRDIPPINITLSTDAANKATD